MTRVTAPAKFTLSLNITGLLADGYHDTYTDPPSGVTVRFCGAPGAPGMSWPAAYSLPLVWRCFRMLLAADAEDALPESEVAVDVFVVDVTGGDAGRDLTFELRRNGISADRAFDRITVGMQRVPGRFWKSFWNHPDPSLLRLPDDGEYVANRMPNGPWQDAALWASVHLPTEALEYCLTLRSTKPVTRDLIVNALDARQRRCSSGTAGDTESPRTTRACITSSGHWALLPP